MKVTHKTYGRGEVVGKRLNGFEMEVQFESGKRLWVKSSQLVEDKPSPAALLTSAPLPSLNGHDIAKTRRVKARRIIEALRLGIAPDGHIERLTFGRRAEIDRITAWLNEPGIAKQPVFLIEGGYGVGKTHLLAYMRHQALKLNYAVANVQVDGIETPFYMPKRVYAALAKSFAYPKADGSSGDFRSFITEHHRQIPTQQPHRPYFFAEASHHLDNPDWWDWLMGKGGDRYYSAFSYSYEVLRDQQNTGNIYSYMLSFLGWLAGKAGLRGLLLIFDEAESFDFTTWRRIQKGLSFIRTLSLCSYDEEIMLQRPDTLDLETLEDYGLDFGSRSGHIPPLYRAPSHLRMLMAFTDLSSIYRQIPWFEDMPMQVVEPLQGQQVAQAVDELAKIYDEAYNVALSQDERQALIQSLEAEGDRYNIRHYIKQSIEYMDLVRHGWPEVER
jgi:hypothetical protein